MSVIKFTHGDLLKSDAEAIVNTVNTVGVMGKGLALQFKQHHPHNFRLYVEACSKGEVRTGKMFVTISEKDTGPQWIINFPTKQHWRDNSKMEWILDGLKSLRNFIEDSGLQSIAIPALGAGNGGLEWEEVKSHIVRELEGLEGVEIIVYEPRGD